MPRRWAALGVPRRRAATRLPSGDRGAPEFLPPVLRRGGVRRAGFAGSSGARQRRRSRAMFAAGCWRPSTSSSLPDDTRPHACGRDQGRPRCVQRDRLLDGGDRRQALPRPRSSRSCRARPSSARSRSKPPSRGRDRARRDDPRPRLRRRDRLDLRGPPHGSVRPGRRTRLPARDAGAHRERPRRRRGLENVEFFPRPRWTPFRCPTRASTTSSRTAS